MSVVNLLLVGAGGALGSIARYLTTIGIDRRLDHPSFPFGTLTVNVLGSLVIGLVLSLFMKKVGWSHMQEWRLFLATGFCGGFTTFSAFAVENLRLFQDKSPGIALLYISVSVIGGLIAVWAGFVIGRSFL